MDICTLLGTLELTIQHLLTKWCLGRFLPLLIGDFISDDYQYLTYLEIIDEVFAPITSPERADYVGMLIEDFLEEFKLLYPDRPLTPKMHYLVHIPTWMKKYFHNCNHCIAILTLITFLLWVWSID